MPAVPAVSCTFTSFIKFHESCISLLNITTNWIRLSATHKYAQPSLIQISDNSQTFAFASICGTCVRTRKVQKTHNGGTPRSRRLPSNIHTALPADVPLAFPALAPSWGAWRGPSRPLRSAPAIWSALGLGDIGSPCRGRQDGWPGPTRTFSAAQREW